MEISKEELLSDIEKLKRRAYRVKSLTEYKYLLFCIGSLAEIYSEKYLEAIDGIDILNPYYDELILRKKDNVYDMYSLEYFNNQKFNSKMSGNVIKVFEANNFYSLDRVKSQRRFKENEFFEIIRAFFADYDERLYKYFTKIHDGSRIETNFNDVGYCGVTYDISLLNKQYTFIDEDLNIENMSTCIHEIAHAYTFETLNNKSRAQSYYYDKSFMEMYSYYLERMFNDYLIKNNMYTKDAVISENELLKYLYEYMCTLKSIDDFDINEITFEDKNFILNSMLYSYGIYLGIIKAEDAKDDLEGTKERLNDFISYLGLSTKDKELETLGVDKKELLKCKTLTKVLNEHDKRLKKYL